MIARGAIARVACLACGGLLVAAVATASAGERRIAVETPGWTAIRLDATAALHAAAGDLALEGPDGAPVRFRIRDDEESSRRPVQVVRVEETGEAWRVVLDVGANPPRHTRLTFAFEQTAVAEVVLEGGDGETFSPLTAAGLFRLGEEADLRRSAIDYPPTADRYLRLVWPRAAELPRVERAEVETVGDARALEVVEPRCEVEGKALSCALEPAPLLALVRRVDLRLTSAEPLGYRLLVAAGGRETVVADGVRRRVAGDLRLPVAAPSGAAALRLELYGASRPPALDGAELLVARPALLFRAEAAGAYVLSWGAGGTSGDEDREPDGRLAWAESGEDAPRAEPKLPRSLVAPGAPLPEARWAGSWPVGADGVAAGALVRLELPPEVSAATADGDPSALRLDAGGRQVPFVLAADSRPSTVLARRGLRPAKDERPPEGRPASGWTALRIEAPAGAPLTELVLESPAGPFSRPLALFSRQQVRPGVPDRLFDLGAPSWSCDSPPPLPCRLAVELPARLPQPELRLELHDGDDAPVESLDLTLHGRTDFLLFAWPGEPVELRVAAERLPTPAYDLESRRSALLVRDATAVHLVTGGAAAAPPAAWTRWAVPLVLAVAALALLAVFGRVLKGGG